MTSKPTVVKYSEFDPKNIVFSDVRKTKYGSKKVYISYKNPATGGKPHRLYLQLPEMRAPFGISQYDKEDKRTGKVTGTTYSISMSFNRENPRNALCEDKMSEFDNVVKQQGANNSVKWLEQEEIIDAVNDVLYTATVRKPKQKPGEEPNDYPNTIRANIAKDPNNDKFYAAAFMGNGEYEEVPTGQIDPDTNEPVMRRVEVMEEVDLLENVTKGSRVIAILQCTGVWFGFGKYGVSWSLKQLRIMPNESLQGYSILPDDDHFFTTNTKKTGTKSDSETEKETDESGTESDAEVIKPVKKTTQRNVRTITVNKK